MHGKGHFVFINVTTESKRHGLKTFAVKKNKITTLEQLPNVRYKPKVCRLGSVINLQRGQSVTLLNLGGTTRIVTRPLLRDEIFIFTDKGVCSYEHQSEFKRR